MTSPAPTPGAPRVKVLYVLGRGRSGSTIFANVLGAYEGFFSAGEVRYLWDPVVRNGGVCACGETVQRCEVWSQVLRAMSDVDVAEAARLQRAVVSERNLPRLLRSDARSRWSSLDAYAALMERVYRALSEVTGAEVIVDSSKRPSYAAVVRTLEGCELYGLLTVRDPRASAHSWSTRRHASVFGGGREVRRRGAFDSTLRWDVLNFEAERVLARLPADRRMTVRYEDFAAQPQVTTSKVVTSVTGTEVPSPFVDERTLDLPRNHAIAGNPSRFDAGKLTIEDRATWRTEQPWRAQVAASITALPYLRRYGYPLRPR